MQAGTYSNKLKIVEKWHSDFLYFYKQG